MQHTNDEAISALPQPSQQQPSLAQQPETSTTASTSYPTEIKEIWANIVTQVQKRPALGWVAKSLLPDRVDEQKIYLNEKAGSHLLNFLSARQRDQLTDLLGQIVGHKVILKITPAPTEAKTPTSNDSTDLAKPASENQKAMQLPLVKHLIQEFGATLVGVQKQKPQLEQNFQTAIDKPSMQEDTLGNKIENNNDTKAIKTETENDAKRKSSEKNETN